MAGPLKTTHLAVNWTVFATMEGLTPYGLINLSLFGAIVLATAPSLWAWFGADARTKPDAGTRQP